MAGIYRQHHPERTVLYRLLFHYFDEFLSDYLFKRVAFCRFIGRIYSFADCSAVFVVFSLFFNNWPCRLDFDMSILGCQLAKIAENGERFVTNPKGNSYDFMINLSKRQPDSECAIISISFRSFDT